MRSIITEVALNYLGVPYRFGGNYMPTGLDCSGFVCEVLRSVGILGKQDLCAEGLHNFLTLNYKDIEENSNKDGSIIFFGKSLNDITHVAIQINSKLMIESGGGDSTTVDLKTAEKQNAYVRIRPIAWRSDRLVSIYKEVRV